MLFFKFNSLFSYVVIRAPIPTPRFAQYFPTLPWVHDLNKPESTVIEDFFFGQIVFEKKNFEKYPQMFNNHTLLSF